MVIPARVQVDAATQISFGELSGRVELTLPGLLNSRLLKVRT
jgi:hypothetical protein